MTKDRPRSSLSIYIYINLKLRFSGIWGFGVGIFFRGRFLVGLTAEIWGFGNLGLFARAEECRGCRPEIPKNLEVEGRRMEVGGRRREVGARRREVGDRRREVGDRRSEVGARRR